MGIAGPKIAALLPLWLAGVGCYHITKRQRVGAPVGLALYLCSFVALAYHGAMFPEDAVGASRPLTLDPDRFAGYLDHYATGLLFAVHLLGFDAFSSRLLGVLNRFARPIRWVAGATFSMYLFHLPILKMMVAVTLWPPSSTATLALLLLGTPAVVFVLAELTERRKEAWRRMFARLLGHAVITERPA